MITRNLSVFVAKALMFCASLLVSATAALAASTVMVERIEFDGKAVAQLANVSMLAVGSEVPVVQTLREKGTVAERMQIIVPARTVITLKSSNGNTMTLQPGSRFTVRHVGDDGESYTLDDGSVSFDVVKALNFFNVNYRKFLAIVKGTKFSVEVEPEKEIRFAVTEGTVVVEREVKVSIAEPQEEEIVALFTVRNILEPGSRDAVTYRLSVDEYLKRFETLKDAEDYYRKQLEADETIGGTQRLQDSLVSLGTVLHRIGKSAEALTVYSRALSLVTANDPHRANLLMGIAAAHLTLGRASNALDLYQQADLIVNSINPGRIAVYSAQLANGIASSHLALGQHQLALSKFEEALAVANRLSSEAATDAVLSSEIGIAQAARALGQLHKVIEYRKRATATIEALHRYKPTDQLIYPYLAAADILFVLGDKALALAYVRKAQSLVLDIYPVGAFPVLTRIYRSLGEFSDDETLKLSLYGSALSNALALYPDGRHMSVAQANLLIGRLQFRQGRYSDSQGRYENALLSLRAIYPDEKHLLVSHTYSALAEVHRALRQNSEAGRAQERAAQLTEALILLGARDDCAIHYEAAGRDFRRASDFERAIVNLERALTWRTKQYHDDLAPKVLGNIVDLAENSYETQNHQRTARYYERLLKAVVAQPKGWNESLLARTHEALSRTYARLGDLTAAEKHAKQARSPHDPAKN